MIVFSTLVSLDICCALHWPQVQEMRLLLVPLILLLTHKKQI